jgi:hypothetical protein
MPSAAAVSIYLFGVTSLAAGINNLLSPQSALTMLQLPEEAIYASNGMSLAAIAIGIYYPLAAYQENHAFFLLTVPMRLLTAAVFWSHGGVWRSPSAWEGGGALLTAAGLLWGLYGGAKMKRT